MSTQRNKVLMNISINDRRQFKGYFSYFCHCVICQLVPTIYTKAETGKL